MNLTGFRTFIVMVMGGTIAPWLANHGLTLTPDQQTWFVGLVMAGLGILMRLFTRTPPGKATPVSPIAVPIVLLLLSCLLAVPALSACTTLSFDETLASGYATYTTVEAAADAAYVAGTLPRDQALQARAMAKDARPFLDAAKAAETAGDTAGASQDLALATSALTALQTYVNKQAAAQAGGK